MLLPPPPPAPALPPARPAGGRPRPLLPLDGVPGLHAAGQPLALRAGGAAVARARQPPPTGSRAGAPGLLRRFASSQTANAPSFPRPMLRAAALLAALGAHSAALALTLDACDFSPAGDAAQAWAPTSAGEISLRDAARCITASEGCCSGEPVRGGDELTLGSCAGAPQHPLPQLARGGRYGGCSPPPRAPRGLHTVTPHSRLRPAACSCTRGARPTAPPRPRSPLALANSPASTRASRFSFIRPLPPPPLPLRCQTCCLPLQAHWALPRAPLARAWWAPCRPWGARRGPLGTTAPSSVRAAPPPAPLACSPCPACLAPWAQPPPSSHAPLTPPRRPRPSHPHARVQRGGGVLHD